MEVLDRYKEYNEISKKYLEFVEQLVEMDFKNFSSEEIKKSLATTKDELQELMEVVSSLEAEEDQETNLKDLNYLVMDALFLAGDLAHFYQVGETGRFKMRALNAINKKRRAEMFKETPSGSGSCPIQLM